MPDSSEDKEVYSQARPMACPECRSTRGYSRVGAYRVQCLSCNSLIKNSEVDVEDQTPQ